MPASPRRPVLSAPPSPVPLRSIPLLSCLVLLLTVVLGGPASAATDYSSIRINEVQSDPDDVVELVNTGDAPVDLSGLVLRDSENTGTGYTIASGTVVAGKAYVVLDVNVKGSAAGTVGLGKGDSVRLFSGTTLLDSTTWPANTHATTWARCADGTGQFSVTPATLGTANQCTPDPQKVRLNEVRSDGTGPDFVELVNTGTQPVDLTGWKAVDADPLHTPTAIAPAGTTVAPGAFFAFETDALVGGFGLGKADSITVSLPDGTAVDTYEWTTHRTPSAVRCPQGTGAFVISRAATPGAANACPVPAGADQLKINEVESDPADLVELVNTGDAAIDVSGYVLKDNDDTHAFAIPSGTVLGAGAVKSFDVTLSYGLGKGDSARLYTPDGSTLLDATTWPADTHATTWGRCPNGTGAFTTTASTIGLPNQCAAPADPRTVIRINEVESNGDKVADWVELTNTGTSTVDVSGWKILDADASHASTPVVVPAKTTIAPGAFFAIYTEVNQSPGFGLGGADSATLYLADGTTKVDSYEWTAHAATTYGRCPDGTGDFRTTTTSTRGASNACSPVRLNEIGPDWVELANIGDAPLDVSGWTLKDSGDAGSHTFPTGTTVPAKGYRVVEAGTSGFGFSLGAGDSVRLLGADGAVVESYTWTNPAAVTYGRCKDGVGDFVDTRAATKGAANACPGLGTEPWPGSQDVRTADLASTFTQDLSGLAFDPKDPDVLWAAQNKLGTLFKLVRDGQTWVPATTDGWGAGKTPTYLDGTGAPDTEGLTIGPDGFVYAAAERNNAASGVSRMSILRYAPDTADTTLRATDEWNLTSQIPAAGANLGLEGVTWVPDSFLVAGGFVDQSTNKPYVPSDYPLHGTGLYVVAVEDTGALHAFALDSTGGTSHRVATISSGFAHLADVTFDAERQRLWAVTDDTHDGKTSLLQLKDGAFTVAEAHDRPATMPNLNNEGFALAPQSRCVDGLKEVVWSDDGDTGGHSIRTGTITCTPATTPVEPQPEPTPVPVDRVAPVVTIAGVAAGRLYVGAQPTARCTATDETSGPVACRLTKVVTPKRTTLTARATDAAGNTGTRSVTYRTLAYEVRGATYRGGKFTMERGRRYTLDGTVEASGRVLGPARLGTVAKPSARLKDGRATVRVPRSAKVGSTWKILVVEKSRSYTIKVRVAR
ncbi:lamin tail domain-containing protein [Aeromicrobium sp. CFBP 8757]|uniref:lamin tail domain-containing protein n=1 Tax=Aeromicrobium sp. CFBP 8757 TaxID=2775288 RepID=UPI00177D4C65|nr:lamin tail domain-containing protein [Aeromicrobium sp. CFBP 8757]MBD8608402.1 lamin tail domain-containing protein [Aeromicrobium sp. CFBP 8757]